MSISQRGGLWQPAAYVAFAEPTLAKSWTRRLNARTGRLSAESFQDSAGTNKEVGIRP